MTAYRWRHWHIGFKSSIFLYNTSRNCFLTSRRFSPLLVYPRPTMRNHNTAVERKVLLNAKKGNSGALLKFAGKFTKHGCRRFLCFRLFLPSSSFMLPLSTGPACSIVINCFTWADVCANWLHMRYSGSFAATSILKKCTPLKEITIITSTDYSNCLKAIYLV